MFERFLFLLQEQNRTLFWLILRTSSSHSNGPHPYTSVWSIHILSTFGTNLNLRWSLPLSDRSSLSRVGGQRIIHICVMKDVLEQKFVLEPTYQNSQWRNKKRRHTNNQFFSSGISPTLKGLHIPLWNGIFSSWQGIFWQSPFDDTNFKIRKNI